MNKRTLESKVYEKLGIPQYKVNLFVNTLLESITEVLEQNEEVSIRGFGTFLPKRQKPRPVRNPQNGDPCILDPSLTVKFTVGSDLKKRLNENDRTPEYQQI